MIAECATWKAVLPYGVRNQMAKYRTNTFYVRSVLEIAKDSYKTRERARTGALGTHFLQ